MRITKIKKQMRKLISILLLLTLTTNLISCKDKIVYRDKPEITDSTTLVASAKTRDWRVWFKQAYYYESKMYLNRTDSIKMKAYADSLLQKFNILQSVLQDSTVYVTPKK